MPQRFLRPGIRTSPRWNAVSHRACRLYIAILTLADDYGRYDGRPSVLWADAFAVWNAQNPPQVAVIPPQVAADCGELQAAGLVGFYEVDGRMYLQVFQWQERPRGKSKWPDPQQEFASNLPQIASKPPQLAAEIGGILPPSPLVIAPSHRQESSPSPLAVLQEPKNQIAEVKWMLDELGALYRRKPTDHPSNIEESTAAQLIRDRGDLIRQDVRVVCAYNRALDYRERKFFPNSLSRLLTTWMETIDKARNSTALTEHNSIKRETERIAGNIVKAITPEIPPEEIDKRVHLFAEMRKGL